MMGMTVVQEIYFDDYGAKQARLAEFKGKKMRGSNERINFLDKSDKNIRRNKIKELGNILHRYTIRA